MLIGGIYFGEKTIWDGILENMRMIGLWSDDEIDSMKGKTKKEEPQNDLESLVESLLNYKDVLEGKVRELEQENEKLHAEIERQDEEIEKLQTKRLSNVAEFKKLNCKINAIRSRCREEVRGLFDNGEWGLIEICRVGEKKECDCGSLKKQIEELQSEVRDLTAENVKLAATNSYFNNIINEKKKGIAIIDKCYDELKEKYETADLERENLAKELDRLRELVKELKEIHQQDCIDLNKKQTTINELVDNYSELRRTKGLSAF